MKQKKKPAAKRKTLKRPKPDTVTGTTLGQRVKSARQMKGMTQLELAHAIDYQGDDAGAYVSRVENGQSTPRLDTLQRIAAALGVSACSLLPG